MDAEQIVRLLADASPNYHDYDSHSCGLCEAFVPTLPGDHEGDCPWRLAVEWVHAHVADADPSA